MRYLSGTVSTAPDTVTRFECPGCGAVLAYSVRRGEWSAPLTPRDAARLDAAFGRALDELTQLPTVRRALGDPARGPDRSRGA